MLKHNDFCSMRLCKIHDPPGHAVGCLVVKTCDLVPQVPGKPFPFWNNPRLGLKPDDFFQAPLPKVVFLCAVDELDGEDPAFGILDAHDGMAVNAQINGANPEKRILCQFLNAFKIWFCHLDNGDMQFPTGSLPDQHGGPGGITFRENERLQKRRLTVNIGFPVEHFEQDVVRVQPLVLGAVVAQPGVHIPGVSRGMFLELDRLLANGDTFPVFLLVFVFSAVPALVACLPCQSLAVCLGNGTSPEAGREIGKFPVEGILRVRVISGPVREAFGHGEPSGVADDLLVFLKHLKIVGHHLPVQPGGATGLLVRIRRHEQVVPESFGESVQAGHFKPLSFVPRCTF